MPAAAQTQPAPGAKRFAAQACSTVRAERPCPGAAPFAARFVVVGAGEPVRSPSFDQTRERRNVRFACVQGRNVPQCPTPRLDKDFVSAYRDLFQRFETVGGETRTEDVDPAQALAPPLGQRFVGVRAQPFLATDPRLERDKPFSRREIQPFGDETRRRVAFAVVRIARLQKAPRKSVKREQQPIRPGSPGPCGFDRRGERVDVAAVVVVAIDEAQCRYGAAIPTASGSLHRRWSRRSNPNTGGRAGERRFGWPRRRAVPQAPRRSTACRSACRARPPGGSDAVFSQRSRSASVMSREFTSKGEPSGVQMLAYARADRAGRMRSTTPCRIGRHSHPGRSTTLGSARNSARYRRTERAAGASGVPRLVTRTPMRSIPEWSCGVLAEYLAKDLLVCRTRRGGAVDADRATPFVAPAPHISVRCAPLLAT